MTALDDAAAKILVRRGFALEYATLGWNVAGVPWRGLASTR